MSKTVDNEEISIKELIILVQSYLKELLKYWWVFIIAGPLGGAIMFYKTSLEEPVYTSELTYMMESDNGSSMGAVAGLLGSFGFGGGGDNNVDKMIALVKSRAIIKESLFRKVSVEGKVDFFGNHIMRSEDIEVFVDEEMTERFFFTRADFSRTDRLENEALMKVYKAIVGGEDGPGLLTISKDELSGFITIKTTFFQEELSVEYPNELFSIVERYFIDKTIEKSQNTFDIIKSKHDSIVGLISATEYQLAKEYDSGKNLLLRTNQLDKARLEKDIQVLYQQYAEIVKNLELSEFSLLSITPVIQPVDLPIYPIKPTESSLIVAIAIGGIVGGLLTALVIIVLKFYRDTMKEESENAIS